VSTSSGTTSLMKRGLITALLSTVAIDAKSTPSTFHAEGSVLSLKEQANVAIHSSFSRLLASSKYTFVVGTLTW
jgi:hypothetical protein